MTIKQIAELAGVSRATVSKIINDYDDINDKTKERVKKIMEEHNYRPSYSAQTLARKKTNVVGVVYAGEVNADFNHPFFVEVLSAFKRTIGTYGYDMLFFSNEKFHTGSEDFLARCLHYNVDGCVIINGGNIQSSVYELDQSDIPCVGLDLELTGPKSSYVMSDNDQMMGLVVDYIQQQGWENAAYVSGMQTSIIATIRDQSFYKAAADAGLTLKKEWILEGNFSEQGGFDAMKRLEAGGPLPDVVFAAGDMMAFGAVRAWQESGRGFDSMAFIGLDDIFASRYLGLTTVRQQQEKLGESAAHSLFGWMENNVVDREVLIPGELVVRASTTAKR
ncbi:LacI family DNA-binding transcriptional regulator [Alkalicoccus urumqiensis]|nr:LacI family DNA-binding transcriptional regulator [Alkalicoccus urumqiensis]